jgi:hypothetical protein
MVTGRQRFSQRAGEEGETGLEAPQRKSGMSWWHWLLLAFAVLVLWVPLYNRAEPSFIGLPFFYWFQLLLVLVGAALTAVIYFATQKK